MASNRSKRRIVVTERDLDIFRSLERTPLTPEQLLRLSATFPEPFPTLNRVQRRFRQLADAGQARSWRYATTGQGSGPLYYKLTLDAYRILHGQDATLPTKRFLQELPIGRHHHTRSLADFLVHTMIAADRLRIQITDFHPENTLRIAVGDHALFPDTSFSLSLPNGCRFTYHIELDNSTEPIRSIERLDSWQQKLHLYHQHAIDNRDRFKLLVVTTKNSSRLSHILDLAAQLNPNPSYSLVSGVALPEYLAAAEPLSSACFCNERNMRMPLLRIVAGTKEQTLKVPKEQLAVAAAACYRARPVGRPSL